MSQQSTKWWDKLNDKSKAKVIQEWKQISGPAMYGHYKEWPNNMIMVTPSIIEMIYNDTTKSNEKQKSTK
jgi:hypothetical protein